MSRWVILAGAVAVQLAIGGVYAWSVFARAFSATMNLTPVQGSLPFQVAIGMIFVGSYVGGRLQDARGPRLVAMLGVTTYAAGTLLASLARSGSDLWLLVTGYGVLGGFGLGLAYIVPIAMLQKWFPDHSAVATGTAVAGFGFGAVITSPVAQALIDARPDAPASAFLPIGIGYLVVGLAGASTFRNPPSAGTVAGGGLTPAQALRTPSWYLLVATLALSVTAGISLISVAADAMVRIAGMSAVAAAAAVGILGLFNGAGRLLWAAISVRIGRTRALGAILLLQGLALVALPHAASPVLFLSLAAVIYACYGGGFGTLPSTAGVFFGLRHAGAIYGLMLVGWSVGGVAGPMLIALLAQEGQWSRAFTVVGVLAVVGAVVPLLAGRAASQVSRGTLAPSSDGSM